MPALEHDNIRIPGRRLAILAESLYLLNLLLLPGLAFIWLLVLSLKYGQTAPPLARNHLQQAFMASIWAGGLLLLPITVLLAAFGGSLYTWMLALILLLCCHAALVLLGVMGLARAMNGLYFRYWLIGPRLKA